MHELKIEWAARIEKNGQRNYSRACGIYGETVGHTKEVLARFEQSHNKTLKRQVHLSKKNAPLFVR